MTGSRMAELFVTLHAVERYQQRVEDVCATEVKRRLNAPVFQCAADFGARYVKLPGGQRVVIVESRVITVLSTEHGAACLDRQGDYLHEREARGG